MKRSLVFILISIFLATSISPLNLCAQTRKKNVVLKQKDNESEFKTTYQKSIKKRENLQKRQREQIRKNQSEQDNDSSLYNKKPSKRQRSIKQREKLQKKQRRRSAKKPTLSDNE